MQPCGVAALQGRGVKTRSALLQRLVENYSLRGGWFPKARNDILFLHLSL
jgi:hypothetical protein